MPNLPNYLAGNEDLGSWAPVQIYSGDADIHSDGGVCGANFAIYTVLAKNPAGLLVPHAPAAEDSTATALYIAAQAGVTGRTCPYFTAGQFNPAALVWDASLTTLAQRQAAFAGTPVIIKAVY